MNTYFSALLLLVTVITWGIQYPLVADVLPVVDPLWITLLRYAIAAPLMLLALIYAEGRRSLSFEGRFMPAAAWGTLGFWGFSACTLVGLRVAPPEHIAMIVALLPLSTAMVGWLVYDARPSRLTVISLILALGGVAVLLAGGRGFSAVSADDVMALAAVFIGMLGWSAYTVALPQFIGWSALRVTALTCTASLPLGLLVVAVGVVLDLSPVPHPEHLLQQAWPLLYTGLFATAAAMLCWNLGVRRIGAVNGALFMNLVPIVAFLVRIGQGHAPAPAELVGAATTIAALLLGNVAMRRGRLPVATSRADTRSA